MLVVIIWFVFIIVLSHESSIKYDAVTVNEANKGANFFKAYLAYDMRSILSEYMLFTMLLYVHR